MEKASTPRFCNVAGCRKPHQAVVSTLEPGTSAEAELTLPARIAYRTAHRRQGSPLSRKSKVEP